MVAKHKILYLMAGVPHEFGGGKRCFLQLMKNIDKNIFEVYSCCALNENQELFLKNLKVNIVEFDIQHGMILPTITKLTKFLRNEKIDIIHSQGARADVYSRVGAKLAGGNIKIVNTIAMLVEGYDVNRIRRKVYCFFDRITERYVNKFIVVSEMLKNNLIENHRIAEENVVKIYNGIEVNQYHNKCIDESVKNIRDEFDIESKEYLIGAIGRMVWQKGFEYLVLSIQKIILSIPRAKILFVGNGPLKASLEALCEKLKLKDNVIFTGYRNDIREILSSVDLLVIPSILEGFPMITLEAMAMAKPIIATNIEGVFEQIKDGENGTLIPAKDHNALAKAIITHFNNREISEKMGLAARKLAKEKYSIENTIRQTESVYNLLLNGK